MTDEQCEFPPELKGDFSFIKKGKVDHNVKCAKCNIFANFQLLLEVDEMYWSTQILKNIKTLLMHHLQATWSLRFFQEN